MPERACQQERDDWTQYEWGECESDSESILPRTYALCYYFDPLLACREYWDANQSAQLEKEGHSAMKDKEDESLRF